VKRYRPRENQKVNGWWMCDTGRFAFGHVNAKDRLAHALVRTADGAVATSIAEGLARVRGLLAERTGALVVLSPFCTVEEGAALLAFANARGAKVVFVSPASNGLADKLLHTGDPAPNRRGLTELGIAGVDAKELVKQIAAAPAALLAGERVCELLGRDALRALPPAVQLAVFDCHAPDAAACVVAIGVPTWVERTGTYVNVDGHRGPIAAAKPAPAGVRALTRLLRDLDAVSEVRS
jgi:NADH-quinone oxidoreductase subunit G